MEYRTCEERVLGELATAEARVEELEGEVKRLQDTVTYADKVVGLFKQMLEMKFEKVEDKDKVYRRVGVIRPKITEIKLDTKVDVGGVGDGVSEKTAEDNSYIISMLGPLIGDGEVMEWFGSLKKRAEEDKTKAGE